MFDKLNKWSMDMFLKSIHHVKLETPKFLFTCTKCTGEWSMKDKKGIEPIFDRPYITCPHCSKKAKPENMER